MRLDTLREELRRVLEAFHQGRAVPIDPDMIEDILWFLDLLRKREGFNVERPVRREQRRRTQEDLYEDLMRAKSQWDQAFSGVEFEEILRRSRQRWQGEYFYDHDSDTFRSKREDRPRDPPKSSNENNRPWYEVLGVRPDATIPQRQKAYRRAAMRLHPDRPGGDTKKFQELQKAKKEAGL